MKKKKQLSQIGSKSLLSEMEKLVVYGGENVVPPIEEFPTNDPCNLNGSCSNNSACSENGVCVRNSACYGFSHCTDVIGV